MKKLILIVFAASLLIGCNKEQRYFAESPEINTAKAGIVAYESGDWAKWKSHFADTAKIYVNSTKSMTVAERHKELLEAVSTMKSYGFDKEKQYIEMVVDKEKETWVYYWSTWNGETNTNKKISVPVHLAIRFVDGKIVTEHVYYDATVFSTDAVRYTQKSSEIETSKAIIKSYNNKDWEALTRHYADTAKVYFNVTEKNPMPALKIPEYHNNNDVNYASRGFIMDKNEFEMVVTDKGDTWVNFWGTWKCKLKANGKEFEIPVHLTSQYINGKIVKEFGYWDASNLAMELQSLE